MKVTSALALVICSVGFFSAIPAAHAQSGWQIASAVPDPASILTIGTGSMPTTVVFTAGTVTSSATASSTGSQHTGDTNPSAYQFSEVVTYTWMGKGPSVPFHVSVTPTATASANSAPYTLCSSSSSASTQPGNVTATANASGGTLSGNNNPGSYPLPLNSGGVSTASLRLNLSAQASGNVYVSGHLYSCASSAIVSLGAPTVP